MKASSVIAFCYAMIVINVFFALFFFFLHTTNWQSDTRLSVIAALLWVIPAIVWHKLREREKENDNKRNDDLSS